MSSQDCVAGIATFISTLGNDRCRPINESQVHPWWVDILRDVGVRMCTVGNLSAEQALKMVVGVMNLEFCISGFVGRTEKNILRMIFYGEAYPCQFWNVNPRRNFE